MSFYRSSYCSYAWSRFIVWNPAFPVVWLFHHTCLFCIRCCFVYLLVPCPVQRLSLFHLPLPSFMAFTLCHMRGIPSYKMNVALFFSIRMVCGCAIVSTVATRFLKALSHPWNWYSPCPMSLTAGFETWLGLHQCGERWEPLTMAQDSHWEELSLSAIQQVTRKNWHEIKGQLIRVGKWEDNKQMWKTEDMDLPD